MIAAEVSATMQLGVMVVKQHDEKGFPAAVSMEILKDEGLEPAPLGMCLEASCRNWGSGALLEVLNQWLVLYGNSSRRAMSTRLAVAAIQHKRSTGEAAGSIKELRCVLQAGGQ